MIFESKFSFSLDSVSYEISIMISIQDFRIAQLLASCALSAKKGRNLLLKKSLETSLEMMGRCLIASFLTFILVSSPKDNI